MPKNLITIFSLILIFSSFGGKEALGTEYKIGAGDTIQISVWEEPNLNITVPVRPDGMITVPLVGDVTAENKTATDLASIIKEKLKAFIKTPTVTVIIKDLKSNVAYATGGVNKPGAHQLIHKTNLLQFISMIGGFTEFAKIRKAFIVRDNKKIEVNLKKLIKKKDLKYNLIIQKGDVLVVPE